MVLLTLCAASCDSMNDIQSKFTEIEERSYLGKVDSIKSYPGFERAKITWYISSDPRIENTIIYWNNRRDSIVVPFKRNSPGTQKDSVLLSGIAEGSYLYEFRNTNSRGETSLFSSATITVWGTSYGDELNGRALLSRNYDYDNSIFGLEFTDCSDADGVAYTELDYYDIGGRQRTIRLGRDQSQAELSDFPEEGSVRYRTAFFLSEGIDTVYSDYATVNAPEVVRSGWVRQSIGSGVSSRYFDRDGVLYEWNDNGDIITYEQDGKGNFNQRNRVQSLVSRAVYHDFFFFDDDRFIGIRNTSTNNLDMFSLTFEGDSAIFQTIRLNYGRNNLLQLSEFVSAHSFFYSVYRSETALRIWYANNDPAQGWGTGTGTVITDDFDYTAFDLYKRNAFIAIDSEGYLWHIPITTNGRIVAKNRIGKGWDKFLKIVTVGRYVLAMDSEGDFWKFDFDSDKYWLIEQ